MVRQRTREIEQQLHAHQQKMSLALSTSEEVSKRHAARLRKLGTAIEEHTQRLGSLDDPRPGGSVAVAQLEARLCEVEGQQATLADELHSLAAVQDRALAASMGSD